MRNFPPFQTSFLQGAIQICLFAGVVASGVATAQAEINDEAFLFTSIASQKANRMIEELSRSTNPPTDIRIRTIPSLRGGESEVKASIQRIQQEERGKGISIIIVKKPSMLVFSSGPGVLKKLPKLEEVRNNMLSEFRSERYDNGLIQGLFAMQSELRTAFPASTVTTLAKAKENISVESFSDRINAFFSNGKKEAAVEAKREEGQKENAASGGFRLSNWIFYIMYGVIAWMMLPFRRFLGRGKIARLKSWP